MDIQRTLTNKMDSIFVLDKSFDTNLNKLEEGNMVLISGIFSPKEPGKYTLEAEFEYIEGDPVKPSVEITVS
ncbi:MAG: hypothetical protein O7C59_06015 [Rickettsia endosymbiont of Ixodes persulcatus]|nr:hypothetical protein [Rickettsia endosymbiont of Ixodes persulcatus]